ncbi:uncharacterized protein METZ01_LOCUS502654, partial [marine metagenome]
GTGTRRSDQQRAPGDLGLHRSLHPTGGRSGLHDTRLPAVPRRAPYDRTQGRGLADGVRQARLELRHRRPASPLRGRPGNLPPLAVQPPQSDRATVPTPRAGADRRPGPRTRPVDRLRRDPQRHRLPGLYPRADTHHPGCCGAYRNGDLRRKDLRPWWSSLRGGRRRQRSPPGPATGDPRPPAGWSKPHGLRGHDHRLGDRRDLGRLPPDSPGWPPPPPCRAPALGTSPDRSAP